MKNILFFDINPLGGADVLIKCQLEADMSILLTDLSIVCALGSSSDAILRNGMSSYLGGMKSVSFSSCKTVFGYVTDKLPDDALRCNALLSKAIDGINVDSLKRRYSSDRIGIVLGGCNTGINEALANIRRLTKSEWKYSASGFELEQISLGTATTFLKKKIQCEGPAFVVSTACSSSAKAFQSARNLILSGACDCVIVGGVDAFSEFTIRGFNSLEVLSDSQTIPMSKNRRGINLGEGAALFVMEKDSERMEIKDNLIELKGIGESSDAHHITSPDPTGAGTIMSMRKALADAKLKADDISYINLHGTGSVYNDSMEAEAVYRIFGDKTPCASTKPMTGHTLGASGAIELGLSYLMLKHNVVFPHVYDGEFDNSLKPINLATAAYKSEVKNVLSNSFAFGGSNVSVIIGKRNV